MGYKEKFEDFLDKMQGLLDNAKKQGHIIVRVEDLERTFPELREEDSKEKPNGGIVMEDFNEGNGFYKVNLNYLNKEQVEEIEGLVKKWNPELKESEDEKVRKALMQNLKERFGTKGKMGEGLNMIDVLAWFERQGEQVPIVLKFREGDVIEYKSKQWTIIGVDLDNHCYDLSSDECVDFDTAHYAFKLVEQKPIWSEEDEEMLENIIICADKDYFICKEHIDWLKSLKDRLQPKQEWSKEDEDYYDAIIEKLEVTQEDALLTDNQIEFLKSIKDRYTWKPSDEQMEALKEAMNIVGSKYKSCLNSLYSDLKKLKG